MWHCQYQSLGVIMDNILVLGRLVLADVTKHFIIGRRSGVLHCHHAYRNLLQQRRSYSKDLNIITMILPHLTVWSSLFPLRSKKGSSRSGSGWGHYSGTAGSANIKSKILNLQFAINC